MHSVLKGNKYEGVENQGGGVVHMFESCIVGAIAN